MRQPQDVDRLAVEVRKFLDAEILVHVLSGGRVSVRIAGVVFMMKVKLLSA